MARKLFSKKVGDAVDAQKCLVEAVEMKDEMRLPALPGQKLVALEYSLIEQDFA